jgi:hypothetical protein
MRKKRRIQLRDNPTLPQPQRKACWEKFTKLPDGYERRWRRGKTLHILRVVDYKYADGRGRRRTQTRERVNAQVQWQRLLDAVKIQDDDRCDPPWENCDGWEHTADRLDANNQRHRELRDSARCVRQDGRNFILTIDPAQMGLADYEYFHAKGASKQVARQLAAKSIRDALRQLRKWYADGWEYCGVVCEFRTYQASCWGIDDRDYAKKEVGPEMAREVMHSMEADGYVIVGCPTVELHRGQSLESWQLEFQRRQHMFNMEKRS